MTLFLHKLLTFQVQTENVNVDLCNEQTIAPSSQINLDYLEQNTTYYIELIAHNAQGNSSAADLYMTTAGKFFSV